jgi:hypothetical protein
VTQRRAASLWCSPPGLRAGTSMWLVARCPLERLWRATATEQPGVARDARLDRDATRLGIGKASGARSS